MNIFFKKVIAYFLIFISSICFLSFNTSNKSSLTLSKPLRTNYVITSKYGNRYLKEYKSYHFHNGIDLAAPVNTPLYALSFGTVVFTGFNGSYGNTVVISYLNGYKSLYAHMSSNFLVKVNQTVNSNTIVGYIGPKTLEDGRLNGRTTGPHLHFSLYFKGNRLDPYFVLK